MSDPQRFWRLLLSHHGPGEAHRCYRLPWSSLLLCARCLGLYPALLAVVGFEIGVGRFESEWRWLVAFASVTPAVIDWSGAMLFGGHGSNLVRTGTGGLAGIGLGVAFSDYFRDSKCLYFWVLLASLVAVISVVWWARRSDDVP
ncbi:MAG: DUF2085 domain-containing protein [bacterium]